jgi:hypothetical protein
MNGESRYYAAFSVQSNGDVSRIYDGILRDSMSIYYSVDTHRVETSDMGIRPAIWVDMNLTNLCLVDD